MGNLYTSAKTLDKYYTKPCVATFCIEEMLKCLPYEPEYYKFIEPSAGSGNFLFSYTDEAYDVAPEAFGIEKIDFLRTQLKGDHIVVYGNPPYGKRNTLSKAFIKHALDNENVEAIAFVLPSVFRKHTLQKVFPYNWSLIKDITLPADSFTLEGDSYNIQSVFQVWIKGKHPKNIRAKERRIFENEHFKLDKEGDIFVMGASPSTVKWPYEVKPTNRGYWIRTKIPAEKVKCNFENMNWSGYSSANGGVFWLTKSELIDQYEKCYKIGEHNG